MGRLTTRCEAAGLRFGHPSGLRDSVRFVSSAPWRAIYLTVRLSTFRRRPHSPRDSGGPLLNRRRPRGPETRSSLLTLGPAAARDSGLPCRAPPPLAIVSAVYHPLRILAPTTRERLDRPCRRPHLNDGVAGHVCHIRLSCRPLCHGARTAAGPARGDVLTPSTRCRRHSPILACLRISCSACVQAADSA